VSGAASSHVAEASAAAARQDPAPPASGTSSPSAAANAAPRGARAEGIVSSIAAAPPRLDGVRKTRDLPPAGADAERGTPRESSIGLHLSRQASSLPRYVLE
jgi:hypothetical protein